MSIDAYIALGSNLGDRAAQLDQALAALRGRAGVEISRVSTYHETDPVGGPPGQGRYLNAVAQLRTELGAVELLKVLQETEHAQGRVRHEADGPRTLDLDLILYGMEIIDTREGSLALTVPHPRMHERVFVLEPLAEIAPLAVHPVLRSTAADLLKHLRGTRNDGRELADRAVVVTGATSGIGRAIALELAAAGARVIVHGRRQERAEEVVQECRALAGWSEGLLGDLRDAEAHERLVTEAWQRTGGIEVWVNNAGADTLTGAAGRWPFERKLEELWAVDVRATVALSRAVGRRMKDRGRGVILTVGWDQAETGMEGDSGQLFGLAKGAIMCFTKALALDLAPHVSVNCLAPGWVRTAWGESASDAWQERVRRETPLQRWGKPEDIAHAARWLASDAADFLTGQILRVNGGAVRG